MNIICVSMGSARFVYDLMLDVRDRLIDSGIHPEFIFVKNSYPFRIRIMDNIYIDFVMAYEFSKIKGYKPDYFWTSDYDVEKYFKLRSVNEFKNFTDLCYEVCLQSNVLVFGRR